MLRPQGERPGRHGGQDRELYQAWDHGPVYSVGRKHAILVLLPGADPLWALDAHAEEALAARNNWRTRAAAIDTHRANAASVALDQRLRDEELTWQDRAQRFRLQEWAPHEEMLLAASAAARVLHKHPSRASLDDLVKFMDPASILGCRACGLPFDPPVATNPKPPFPDLEPKAAMRKLYGPDAPSNPEDRRTQSQDELWKQAAAFFESPVESCERCAF
jgi:hypothetical protein